jgi:hypothetical protein
MKKPIVILSALLLTACYPNLKRPQDLAQWSKCDPAAVADWIGSMTEYKIMPTWEAAGVVMERGFCDCKGRAVIARDTLLACGNQAYIVVLTDSSKGKSHAVTGFELLDGRRGFINSSQYGIYKAGIPWTDIVKDIDRGQWSARYAQEAGQ